MAIENHCNGAVIDAGITETRGRCDHCAAITTNWYRIWDGSTGFECDRCLHWAKNTTWGDIHA